MTRLQNGAVSRLAAVRAEDPSESAQDPLVVRFDTALYTANVRAYGSVGQAVDAASEE